jgi:P27 family predicted phage terminase small subunit
VPTWIQGEARREWKRIVPELLELGLLTLVDRVALAAYCQAWAELVECTKVLQAEGRLVREPIMSRGEEPQKIGEKIRKHPIVAMQRDAFARVKVFLAEFGLSPSSRSRVRTISKPTEDDPLQELMRRAGKNSYQTN